MKLRDMFGLTLDRSFGQISNTRMEPIVVFPALRLVLALGLGPSDN